ncbi:hypothetical protein COJ01_17455 [Priestia megaterium]|uniref:hypothetical protein n=1 Tax=Priestia megaterium TaxID=1404 RepID=UPI000BF35AF5|nr:hypothetical protein [Priestia megaterium]PFK99853.1 hypothetical protein COJ01_17455 [Priestia megaterium]
MLFQIKFINEQNGQNYMSQEIVCGPVTVPRINEKVIHDEPSNWTYQGTVSDVSYYYKSPKETIIYVKVKDFESIEPLS